MSKKYLETSFTAFVKHKLHETIKSKEYEKSKETKDSEPNGEDPDKESGLTKDKKKPKVAANEYVYELQREFNKIWEEYDNLYGM